MDTLSRVFSISKLESSGMGMETRLFKLIIAAIANAWQRKEYLTL